MADEEEQLIEEARKSREKAQELREESGLADETPEKTGEPWAKTSSGDADEVVEDD
jgi:hypothetical protein